MATLRDAVFGQAVGDALGVPYEFRARDSFACSDMTGHGTHGRPAGTWSDDTSMALAICDSYRERGRVDAGDILARFRAWRNEGAYSVDGLFDIGITTSVALDRGRGCTGERDNGNGSLMRTVPLAFTNATDDEVRAVSTITHAHAIACDACVDCVRAARMLASGASAGQAARAVGMAWVATAPRGTIRSGGYVLDTWAAALWCLVGTSSYEECVLAAVNLGGDTDTTAAVAGALAGIAYGASSIPRSWMDALRGKDVIERCLF